MLFRSVLSVSNCYQADQLAVLRGIETLELMESAGSGMAKAIQEMFEPCKTVVLCGPGANGGDGFVVARRLHEAGWPVRVHLMAAPVPGSDSSRMLAILPTDLIGRPLENFHNISDDIGLIVDCLFGAGLQRPISGELADLVLHMNQHKAKIAAADLPSGIHGDLSEPGKVSILADLTVTFGTFKLAHLLQPARAQCGIIKVVDIGFPADLMQNFPALAEENHPDLWPGIPKAPHALAHKHNRGRLLVACGGPLQTGAARLAARAGLRMGAGWVTLSGAQDAMAVCTRHETSIVLQERANNQSMSNLIQQKPAPDCVLLGPAGGVGPKMRDDVIQLLQSGQPAVLDADALSSFASDPDPLLTLCHENVVLLPHEGEFARLFPDLGPETGNKVSRIAAAARGAGCVVLLKGSDSTMADPSGKVVVNTHTSAHLATLGSGDVLAGMVGGLMAQGHESFAALCAAVWMHGELGKMLGAGLIAEDLPEAIPAMLQARTGG
jgi:NAD(P)H-hydrate epimerase